MPDFFSKRPAPWAGDPRAKALIENNKATITRLADRISNGAYSAAQRRAAAPREPQAKGLIFSDLGAGKAVTEARPYVRISPNRRVVVVDLETNRQMHFLGELRVVDGQRCFVLATAANGFFSPVDGEIAAALAGLDGAVLGPALGEEGLAAKIGAQLGIE
ncbi:MAG: hypothetical protein AAFT19_00460 [Pseudomonadota bacterium]